MNRRRDKVQLNNSGFSLVELIVVVLIMGILAGGAIMAISTVSNADAQRAARNLSSMLTQARQLAISTADSSSDTVTKKVYAEIYFNNGYYYVDICSSKDETTGTVVTVEETKRLGNYHLDITYNAAKGVGDNELLYDQATSTGNRLRIGFDKGSGGINRVGITATDGTGETALNADNVLTDIYCEGSRTEHIILIKETGKNYLD